jgi:pimeloyl-ACP methyl ester carboxylesterase
MAKTRKATFVVAHGAWTGGWSWVRVADLLQEKGHAIHVPTLTGLGERSHIVEGVGLDTHIDDIVNEILWKDLTDIVLVGHSYGGIVATGVVEKVPDRIASLVYVEAFIPKDGQSFNDMVPGWTMSGKLIDAPPSGKGEYKREADRKWVNAKATAQPTATLTQKLKVTGAYLKVPRKMFVVATGWDGNFSGVAEPFRKDPNWVVEEIDCGHDVPIDAPDELVALLERALPGPKILKRKLYY